MRRLVPALSGAPGGVCGDEEVRRAALEEQPGKALSITLGGTSRASAQGITLCYMTGRGRKSHSTQQKTHHRRVEKSGQGGGERMYPHS